MSNFGGFKSNTMGGQFHASHIPSNIGANLGAQATNGNVTGFGVHIPNVVTSVGLGVPIVNKPNYSIGIGGSSNISHGKTNNSVGLGFKFNL